MSGGHHHGSPNAGATHRWRLRVAFALIAAFFVVELFAAGVSGSLSCSATRATWRPTSWRWAPRSSRPGSPADPTPPAGAPSGRSGGGVRVRAGRAAHARRRRLHRRRRLGGSATSPRSRPRAMLVVGILGLVVNLAALCCSAAARRSPQRQGRLPRGRRRHAGVRRGHPRGAPRRRDGVCPLGHRHRARDRGLRRRACGAARARGPLRPRPARARRHGPGTRWRPCVCPRGRDVHDLHVWTLTSGMNVATVHLSAPRPPSRRLAPDAARVMRERFGIEHATLQVEPRSAQACVETSW